MDIIVTMSKNEIDHWNEKISYSYIAGETVWWNMKRLPKYLLLSDKVFVVMDGEIRGYFEIRYIDKQINNNKVYLRDYTEIKCIKMKGFQGFRYRKFKYKLN